MKQTFVNNVQQLMTANQNQRIKINYLEVQKQKRQEYLSGLRQSIMLNKQTLIVLNEQGPNNPAIGMTSKQNFHLIKLNETLYNQNRQLNASMLMEQQLRVEDKAFYLERIDEFQNRITDLRKYLHDKEESFSAVVGRLKKYEEWNQKPLSEKMDDTDGLRKLTNQILAQVVTERNMFQAKFQEVFSDAERYKVLASVLRNKGGNIGKLISQLNAESDQQHKPLSQHDSPRKQLIDFHIKQKKRLLQQQPIKPPVQTNFKQTQITKQLMRLLKKQKLNNQILQNALHSAIEKNEELIKINQNIQSSLTILQRKMEKLIAQNHFFKLKLKEFGSGYGKKYQLYRTKDTSQQPGYLELFKINYEINDEQNQQVPNRVYKDLLKQSLKEDIEALMKIPIPLRRSNQRIKYLNEQSKGEQEERIGDQMTTNDMTRLNQKISQSKNHINLEDKEKLIKSPQKISHSIQFNQIMIKSASQPRIAIDWQDTGVADQHQAEEIVVDEF